MSQLSASYGRRGNLNLANSGIRQLAPTTGIPRRGVFCEKAGGHITVESEGERFISHLLAIHPGVIAFQPQPFCVDLIEHRLLMTKEAMRAAGRWSRQVPGARFYTPDFSVEWEDGLNHSLEVKAQGYEGDGAYQEKLALADQILQANGYPLSRMVFPANPSHPIRLNARVLKQGLHHRYTHLSDALVEKVTARCEAGPITMRTLCADLKIAPGLIPVMLVSGVLKAQLNKQPICGDLEVSLAHGDLSHLCLLEWVLK